MIATLRSTQIAKGLDNCLLNYSVSMSVSTTPFLNLATHIAADSVKHQSDRLRIIKREAPKITEKYLKPAIIEAGDDYRPLNYTVLSQDLEQTLHPATIDISVELMDQSILSHELIAIENLTRYELDLKEIKLKLAIDKVAGTYNSQYGTQPGIPTELTVKDLMQVTGAFKASGNVPCLSQYLSSVAINTSGIPKSFAFIGSFEGINYAKESIEAMTLQSFKSNFEVSGSANYAFNYEGVELSSQASFISSTNYRESNTDPNLYTLTAVCADSILAASSTPTSDTIIKRPADICSPSGLRIQFSTRCAVIVGVTRQDGVTKVVSAIKAQTQT